MGNRLKAYVPDYVVFDLETTGISTYTDAVIEVSAVKVVGGEVVDEFSTLVNPERPIPAAASSVNNIFDNMVKDAPVFEVALKEFLDFVGDSVLVGHNIHSFDMKFIRRDAMEYWGKTIDNDYVDTLYMARTCLPQLSHHRLVDLAKYYGISDEGAHRALADCRMNQKVFECLAKENGKLTEGSKSIKECPICGDMLKMRSGKYGEFWGCTSFPRCRYTENC